MNEQLQALVDSVFSQPTVDRLDALLAELSAKPRDGAAADLIDDLLDYRVVLTASLATAA